MKFLDSFFYLKGEATNIITAFTNKSANVP